MNHPTGFTLAQRTEHVANHLSYLGVLPFAACVLVAMLADSQHWSTLATDIMIAYGGIILAFLGGIHWGRALLLFESGSAPRALIWSILPAMLGLVVLTLTAWLALALLIPGYILLYQSDLRVWQALDWFTDLRGRMTGLVVVLLTIMLAISLGDL